MPTKTVNLPMDRLAHLGAEIDEILGKPNAAGYHLVTAFTTPPLADGENKPIPPLIVLIFQKEVTA